MLRMKPRHAAALALVGWYLMVPPPGPPRSTGANTAPPNHNAPLDQWTIRNSYDSAQACEAAMQKDLDTATTNIDKQHHLTEQRQGLWPNNFSDQEFLVADQLGYAKEAVCISTDDPSLKSK
ncbi:MAG: hypothetical protein WBY93_05540 [Candidatus Binatus sp.]